MSPTTDIEVKERKKINVKPPGMYQVIYLNDDVTTFDFVVETLISIFNYNQTIAEDMTHKINNEGSSVVAVLPFEIAEQKGIEVTLLARHAKFPLQVKLQAE